MGALKFEGATFTLGKDIASFYEIYGLKSAIPHVKVTFESPKVNGIAIEIQAINVNYPDNDHPEIAHKRYSTAKRDKNRVILESVPAGVADGKESESF